MINMQFALPTFLQAVHVKPLSSKKFDVLLEHINSLRCLLTRWFLFSSITTFENSQAINIHIYSIYTLLNKLFTQADAFSTKFMLLIDILSFWYSRKLKFIKQRRYFMLWNNYKIYMWRLICSRCLFLHPLQYG